MEINMQINGVTEISLSVRDLKRSRKFYYDLLNFPVIMETDDFFVCSAGGSRISFFVGGNDAGGIPSPLRFITIGCPEMTELERVSSALKIAGVPRTEIQSDSYSSKKYFEFQDPDGHTWRYSFPG